MEIINKSLKRRIIEISYRNKLSHLGSCLTAVGLINEIYGKKKDQDIFILSSGHAGLALYVVLEKYYQIDASMLFDKHGVHPNRDIENHIWASSGSLGHGLGIAVGAAISNKDRRVYCLISDGEFAEGSIYESLNIAKRLELRNLTVYINCNGFGAYSRIYEYQICTHTNLYSKLYINVRKTYFDLPFLDGQDAHYYTMNEDDYKLAMQIYAPTRKPEGILRVLPTPGNEREQRNISNMRRFGVQSF